MALSISSILNFFKNETRSISRGENHYKFNHINSFTCILRGKVQASIKKVYDVTVSTVLFSFTDLDM